MANNFILELLAGTLAEIGESKLVEVLQTLHDKDVVKYKSVIFGGMSFVTGISELTNKTKSKIDDAIISGIKEAIIISANHNDIKLPD